MPKLQAGITPRIPFRDTSVGMREVFPHIKRIARSQREWDLLICMSRSYKSRLVIPHLKPGRVELGLREILEVCQDDGARVRIKNAIALADSLPPL